MHTLYSQTPMPSTSGHNFTLNKGKSALTFQTASFRRNSCHCAGPNTLSVQRLQNNSHVNRSTTSTKLLRGAHKLQEVTVYTKWMACMNSKGLKEAGKNYPRYLFHTTHSPQVANTWCKGQVHWFWSLCENDSWMFQTLLLKDAPTRPESNKVLMSPLVFDKWKRLLK